MVTVPHASKADMWIRHTVFLVITLWMSSGPAWTASFINSQDQGFMFTLTIWGDAFPLSYVNAEACRTCWPNACVHAGVGKLVNAALLSLVSEACANVCCTTLLSNELVGPACVQSWSSNPRGRACRPSGKGSWEERMLSDVVPV